MPSAPSTSTSPSPPQPEVPAPGVDDAAGALDSTTPFHPSPRSPRHAACFPGALDLPPLACEARFLATGTAPPLAGMPPQLLLLPSADARDSADCYIDRPGQPRSRPRAGETQLFLASGAACFLVLGLWSCLLLDLICGWWPPWPLEIFGISIHLFAARMKNCRGSSHLVAQMEMDVFRSIDPGMSEEEAQRYGDGGGIGGYADAKPATSLLRFKQLHHARDIHSGSFVHMLDPSCNLLQLMIKDVHSLQPVDVLQNLQYGVGMCP